MKLSSFFIFFFWVFLGTSQPLDPSLLEHLPIRNIGPAGMSGRITAIDVVENQPDIIFVGSASGGVWKSTNGGINWQPIFNDQNTASIGAIAIQQSNPSVIWVGTGEGNPRNSLNGGDGIYRSLDGGKTWQHLGLKKTRHIHRIIVHPNDPNTVYVGAIGAPWGEYPDRGLYKTENGGKTWKKILFTNNRSGVSDMVMDPKNPNKIWVAMWEHKRDPWFFTSGGSGSGLFLTHDGGENWKKITEKEGLPKGNLGRIGIAIAPSRPQVIYALIESKKNALYKSSDGGDSWKKINDGDDIGNRPFYYSEIYVDPSNENRVYSIFTYVNVSEDGGKSFTRLMPAYNVSNGVHPDHHAWWIHPQNPDFIIDGNDGGLNISRDRGKTWNFVENIPVGQFYHIAVDNDIPYHVYGGMQDNGSWVGPAYVWKTQGIRNHYWQEISFGDGFDVLPHPKNPRFGVSTAQQGFAGIYDRKTGSFELIRPVSLEKNTKLRFNWNVGMNRDPFDPNTLYFGSQFVHKSTDGGQNWTLISPDLTTNDTTKQKQHNSGGLTIDATGAENFCTILVIEPAPLEPNTLWVGTDDGQVQLTRDGGKTWNNLSKKLPDFPSGAWISQIKASNKNKGEVLLVANDYRRFNYKPYVYKTTNYGKTWTRIVDENDVKSYTLCIVEDPIEKNLLFLGTDDGLYVSIDAGENWTKWHAKSFPTTNVYDMVIHPREHDLVLATFGRAIWILDDIRPLRHWAQKGPTIRERNLTFFPPPPAYLTLIQQPKGSRFGGDALYNGENRKWGAMLTYAFKRKEKDSSKEEKEKLKKDSLTLQIFKEEKRIRTINFPLPKKDGIHRMYWDLKEKGIYNLTRKEVKKKEEPAGKYVLPGQYKLKLKYGDFVDSTTLEVKKDHRLDEIEDDLKSKYDQLTLLEVKGDLIFRSVERIKECMKTLDETQKILKKEEEKYEVNLKNSQNIKDSLQVYLDAFLGEKDERQGITRNEPNSIKSYYQTAYRYTSNAQHKPDKLVKALSERLDKELNPLIEKLNQFFSSQWETYKKEMDALALSPFKTYKKLE